jgi:hypothetical protein
MLVMPHYCPNCKQDFLIEPGFYSGALWMSFPIIIIVSAVLWVAFVILFSVDGELAMSIIATIIFILQPIFMRLGRSLWINIFIEYKGT